MRNSLFGTLLLCYCALTLIGQTPDASCCRLTAIVGSEAPSVLKVTVTNFNSRLVNLSETSAETDLYLVVLSEAGREADRTEHGKELLSRERGGRRIGWQLKQGDSMSQVLDLRTLFELKSGIYKVSIKRSVNIGDVRIALQTKVTVPIP